MVLTCLSPIVVFCGGGKESTLVEGDVATSRRGEVARACNTARPLMKQLESMNTLGHHRQGLIITPAEVMFRPEAQQVIAS
jgi:hypothetical protein